MALVLGVDTGGTYTDAVVYSDADRAVLGSAKSPTTHDDLAIGIGGAIDGALADAGIGSSEIGLVSLSTTLATNALVEDKGRRACLVLIGFDEDAMDRGGLREALQDDELILAPGGHTSHGDEAHPLDVDEVMEEVLRVAPEVDAFAVTSQFSVRNPSHEVEVRDRILVETDRPVTCSHELSANLNGPKRGVTALLNARLIAMIDDLIAAAGAMLVERSIDAPVMIVRGNGSLVSTEFVTGRPIETILSGPAASLLGAAHLTDTADAIISDIGGTTTDIAVVRDGRPEMGPDGASVGGHQTMVEAVLMHTHGIGGDSEVTLRDRAVGPDLLLGPRRVVPVCRLAVDHPDLVRRTLERHHNSDRPGEFDGVFVWRPPGEPRGKLSRTDEAFLKELTSEPQPADAVIRSRVDVGAMGRLMSKGLVRMSSVTPTDAAHVLGVQDDADSGAAIAALAVFARRRDRYGDEICADAPEMAQAIVDTLVRRTAHALLGAAFHRDRIPIGDEGRRLVDAAFDRLAATARVDIGVDVPVVALGAAAATYYPLVAGLLGAPHHVPAHAAVANALGAAVGQVRQRTEVLVSAPRRGVYRVHGEGEPETFFDLDEATAHARQVAADRSMAAAETAGGRDIEVELLWSERSAMVEDKEYFVEGTVTAIAAGRPTVAADRS